MAADVSKDRTAFIFKMKHSKQCTKGTLFHQSLNNSCGTKQQHSEKRAAAEIEGGLVVWAKITKSDY